MNTTETTQPADKPADSTAPDYIGTATYSPEDNKIRISAFSRLSPELYARVKAGGYSWAPRQKIFVAPMWTPDREDLAIELCGELGDEDTSLVDRAEERAERFEGYSERRAQDADSAHAAVSAIADNIPLGQPILVGHHSEKRARRDAERIENGMRKAVRMWETSKYWISRAKGALRHAKYKELPDVRARRIKGIGADKRKRERQLAEAVGEHTFWLRPDLTHEEALRFAGNMHGGFSMPKKDGDRPDFAHCQSPHGALSGDYPNLYAPRTLQEVIDRALAVYPGRIEYLTRWILHYENRLAYETAMLDQQGASHLIAPKKRPAQLPLLNYRQAEIVGLRFSEPRPFPQIELTTAEFMRINSDQRGTLIVEGSHRVRFALIGRGDSGEIERFPRHHSSTWYAVFLTDSKAHPKPCAEPKAPAPAEPEAEADPVEAITQGRTIWNSDCTDGPALICAPPKPEPPKDKGAKFEALKQTLKAGVKVVSAPQLFPTPPAIAERMAELADIRAGGMRVLEPSAGTGNLIVAIADSDAKIVAVEHSVPLADQLRRRFTDRSVEVVNADFLQCNGDLGMFDRVIMNPPFANGADVLHVRHALNKLKPGGKLVAIVAGGPRQKACLEPLSDYWEELPDGTFSEQGTNVRTVLLVIEKRE